MLAILALLTLSAPSSAPAIGPAPAAAIQTRSSPSRSDLRKAVRRLRGKKASTRERAMEVLVAGAGDSVPHLIEGHALGPKGSRDHRPLIRDVLLRIVLDSPKALAPLSDHLASPDEGVAQAARGAFALAAAADALPVLTERAGRGTPEERVAALRLMGRLRSGAAPAEELLVRTVADAEDAALREAAGLAIARAGLRSPAAITALEERARDPEDHGWAMDAAALMGTAGPRILLAGMDVPGTTRSAAASVAVLLEQSEEDAAEALSALIAGAAADGASRDRRARTLMILYLAAEFLDIPDAGLDLAVAQAADSSPAVRACAYPAAAAIGGADERVVAALVKGLGEEVEAEYEPLEALLGAIASLGEEAPSLGEHVLRAWAEMPTARDSLMEAFSSAVESNGCVERDPDESLAALAEIAMECRYGGKPGLEPMQAVTRPMLARPEEGCEALVKAIDRSNDFSQRMGMTQMLVGFEDEAVKPLRRLLGDRSLDVAAAAACCLCVMGKGDENLEASFRTYWQYEGLRYNLAWALSHSGETLGDLKVELLEDLGDWRDDVHVSLLRSARPLLESRDLAPLLAKVARDTYNKPSVRTAALYGLRWAPSGTEGLEELTLDALEEDLGALEAAPAAAFGPLDDDTGDPERERFVLAVGMSALGAHGLTTPAVVAALERIFGSADPGAIMAVTVAVREHRCLGTAAEGMIPSLLHRRMPALRRCGLAVARSAERLGDESTAAIAELMEEDHVGLSLGAATLLADRAAPLDERGTVAMLLAVERAGELRNVLTRSPREDEEADRARPLRLARRAPVGEEELRTILDHLATSIDRHPRVRPAAERLVARWSASADPALRALAEDLGSRMKD